MFQLHVVTAAMLITVWQSSAMRTQRASRSDLNISNDDLAAAATSYNHWEASRYARYAKATYCYGRLEEWACGANCTAHPIHGSDRDRFAGYVAKRSSPAAGEPTCILAFRGTDRWENWLLGADSLLGGNWHITPSYIFNKWRKGGRCDRCMFHSGFFDAYDSLQQQVFGLLDKLDCNTVGVTGHSMGGALAALAAFDIRTSTPHRLVRPVYTFGAPRVGNDAWVTAFVAAAKRQGVEPAAWRIVHHTDIVPAVPSYVVGPGGYRHTPQEVWYTAGYGSHSLCGSVTNGEDNTCSRGLTCYRWGFGKLLALYNPLKHGYTLEDCLPDRRIAYHKNIMNIEQDDACNNPLE